VNAFFGHVGDVLGLCAAFSLVALVVVALVTHRSSLLSRAPALALTAVAGCVVAVAAMEHALITHDFTLAFVAQNNSRQTPLFFSITGLWSALQGSILLWVLILCGYGAFVALRFRHRLDEPVVAIALAVIFAVAVFFFSLMAGPADPFAATRGAIPANGAGPNALLQDNTLVAVHPVFLYLGYVGFTVPFAFAVGSLVTGRVGEGWLSATRRFAIFAWAFLTIGIVLGAWWSYQVLGWGGFWGWDPVENAALLPWLTATAYLHSAMVQERRGLLRIWNLSLLIATFALTILGTFLTRSGVVQSVHAFSDSGLGPALIAFFAVVVAAGVGLIGWRGDRLRSPGGIDAPVSREGAFLVNNLLFAAFALVVLLGTVFPLFVQAFSNQSISIGRPYFDTFAVPLGLALLFMMAVAPALPWRKAGPGVLRARLWLPAWSAVLTVVVCVAAGIRGLTPLAAFGLGGFAATAALRQLVLASIAAHRHGLGFWRGIVGRANGGMVVHLGVVLVAVGLAAASSFGKRTEIALHPGQTVDFDGHTVELLAVRDFSLPNRSGVEAVVKIDGRGIYRPAIDVFRGDTEGVATPSIDSTPFTDVYLAAGSGGFTLAGHGSLATASLDVIVQPLIVWLWSGGILCGLGALLAAVPGRRRRPTDPASLPIPELASVGAGMAS
jgi:cytochrome c-type biogenesis protein CcmF